MVGVSKTKTKKVETVKINSDASSIAIPADLQKIELGEIVSTINNRSAILEIEKNGKAVNLKGLVRKDGFIVYDNRGKITVYPPKTRVLGIIAMFN